MKKMLLVINPTKKNHKMKTIKLFVSTLLIVFALSTQTQGQEIKLGGGLELSSSPPVGMVTKVTYHLGALHPNLRISMDAAVLPELQANMDVHYSFMKEMGMDIFALGGANFQRPFGVNIGSGIHVEMSKSLDAFGEVKYIIGSSPQPSIKLGVLYKL